MLEQGEAGLEFVGAGLQGFLLGDGLQVDPLGLFEDPGESLILSGEEFESLTGPGYGKGGHDGRKAWAFK